MSLVKRGTAKTDTGGADDPLGAFSAELISDTVGLTQFGAFIEELPPGSASSFAHWHAEEDEMVLVLSGTPTLVEGDSETVLAPGDAACWKAGEAVGHCLQNHSDHPVRYLVIGTRSPKDIVTYPGLERILHYDRKADTRVFTTLDGQPAEAPY